MARLRRRAFRSGPGVRAATVAIAASGPLAARLRAAARSRSTARSPRCGAPATRSSRSRTSHALRRALPQAHVEVWDGMGHHPQRERPVALAAVHRAPREPPAARPARARRRRMTLPELAARHGRRAVDRGPRAACDPGVDRRPRRPAPRAPRARPHARRRWRGCARTRRCALTVLAARDLAFTARGRATVIQDPMDVAEGVVAVAIDVDEIQDHADPRFTIEGGVALALDRPRRRRARRRHPRGAAAARRVTSGAA